MENVRTTILALVLLAWSGGELFAQLPDPSARSFGFAGSYTARARGYEAPFWNPANLGLPDRPRWSVGLPGVHGSLANNALSYGQIESLYGEFLDDSKKSEILAEIREGDPNRMLEFAADVGAHWISLSIWRIAVGVASGGTGTGELTPDAVELLLFGNVGEEGGGDTFSLEESQALAWGTTTGFISYAHPLPLPVLDYMDIEASVGATLKYTTGHGLARLRDYGSTLTSDPLEAVVDAELLHTNSGITGSGWSVDLGGAMRWEKWTAGLSLESVLRNMSWNEDDFDITLMTATADFDSTSSNDTTLSFSELSAEDQERVSEFLTSADFPTRLRLGGQYQVNRETSVSVDYEEVIGGELRTGWARTLAVGGEFNLVGVVPVRAGLATNFTDLAYAGGFGIYGGPVHLDFAAGRRGLQGGDGLVVAASLSVWPGMWH